ncbi:MAG: hypothetical protein FJX80_02215 [Bacteroidetes bacterium]|nr:hypothetical protein [Bacteroidota bacterium]
MFFFITEVAVSLIFKVTTWCIGRTYDGILYLVNSNSKTNDNDNDKDEFVVISLADYNSLIETSKTKKKVPV